MRFVDLLSMSMNSLRRRKLRTALTVLGVVIGTASIVVMMSLGIGLKELNQELIESYGSLTAIEVRGDGGYYGYGDGNTEPHYLTDEVVSQMEKMDHVSSVYPLLETEVLFQQGNYSTNATLVGAPREYLEQIPLGKGSLPDPGEKDLKLIYGNSIISWFSNGRRGSSFWETGELPDVDFMGRPMFVIFDMDQYYQSMGDGTQKAPKKYLTGTAGVVEGDARSGGMYGYSVYAQLEPLKSQLKKVFRKKPIPGQPTNKKGKAYPYFVYSSCVVNVDDLDHVAQVQEELTDMGFEAYSSSEWMEQTQQQSMMIQAVLGGIGAISLLVAAIGIANTMMMSIYERTKEIGVIKVLGCDMGAIRNMFLIESGCIGFMGGVAGLLLSYGLSFGMNRFQAIGALMVGQEGDISRIPSWLSLTAVGFAILVGMVAGFFPSLRAMRLSPLAAIRNE
ncbi:MAG: ABC transporter permease [Lachnospiraceae bacterium]|nr:ABC transporter permease [Lachnospiraceae bacterium]